MSTIPNYDHNFHVDLMDLDVTIKEEPRIEDDLEIIIKTEPFQIPVPEFDPEAVGAIVNRVHCPTKIVGTPKLVKRIEMRLERSEVTNSLASIDKAPVSLSDVTVKTEPRTGYDLNLPAIIRKPCCPECKKEFADSRSLHRHIKIHSNEKPYVCSTCMHGFRLQFIRDAHARKKHLFKCDNCELTFVLKRSLEEHAIMHHEAVSRKCYSCPKCKKEFSKHQRLQCHMRVHSTKRPYVCSTCPKSFKWKTHLLRHAFEVHRVECDSNGEVIHHTPSIAEAPDLFPVVTIKEEPRTEEVLPTMTTTESLHCSDPLVSVQRKGFQCTSCQLIFKYRFHLQHHQTTNKRCDVQRNHNSNVKLTNKSLSHQCRFPECNKYFPSLHELRRHLVVHSNERPYVCSKCLLAFKFKHNLSRHTQKEHLFQCEHCELSFLNKYARDVHILKFHPDKLVHGKETLSNPSTCTVCSRVFVNSSNLEKHYRRKHPKERPYLCELCSKSYPCKVELMNHQATNHPENPAIETDKFTCNECGKVLSSERNLRLHKLRHRNASHTNNERNFKCTQCDKTYKRKVQLKHHLKLHAAGTNRLICKHCSKYFANSKSLRNHIAVVHFPDKKSVKCPSCGEGFTIRKYLNRHLLICAQGLSGTSKRNGTKREEPEQVYDQMDS